MRKFVILIIAATLASALAGATFAQENTGPANPTATVGSYSVTLEVLPAESFNGPHADMVWDGGARPVEENGAEHPNHDLAAVLRRNGAIVLNAQVDVQYRRLSPDESQWQELPVARMHDSNRGVETTRFGNNVRLDPGDYAVKVDVDGTKATLHFTLSS
jgi:hypothetical protein